MENGGHHRAWLQVMPRRYSCYWLKESLSSSAQSADLIKHRPWYKSHMYMPAPEWLSLDMEGLWTLRIAWDGPDPALDVVVKQRFRKVDHVHIPHMQLRRTPVLMASHGGHVGVSWRKIAAWSPEKCRT